MAAPLAPWSPPTRRACPTPKRLAWYAAQPVTLSFRYGVPTELPVLSGQGDAGPRHEQTWAWGVGATNLDDARPLGTVPFPSVEEVHMLPIQARLPSTDVFDYFDALNDDASHHESSNDICTPMGCVEEMVEALPDELWSRPGLRLLDSCCGNGNFHAYIQTKAPLDALYFNEINEQRVRHVLDYFGNNVNLTRQDFMELQDDWGFDLVVSNPPYAKFTAGKRASKNHNLSRGFIRKALELTKPGGYILFIVPDNWMSYSDRNVLPPLLSQYQFLHLNIHGAKRWFPRVGSSFTWFVLHKVPNERPFRVENHYMKSDQVNATLPRGVDFIPLYYSNVVRRIMDKVVYSTGNKYEVETTSDLHRTTKRELLSEHEDPEHQHRLIHTPRQTVWATRPHKYQAGWKVFLSLTDRYRTFVDNCGMTQSVAFIRCRSKRDALRIKRELDSPVFRAVNNLTRYGNFNNIRVLQRLTTVAGFRLSRQEDALIQHFA